MELHNKLPKLVIKNITFWLERLNFADVMKQLPIDYYYLWEKVTLFDMLQEYNDPRLAELVLFQKQRPNFKMTTN